MTIKCTTLKNGIRVLTDERKGAKMVSACMHVNLGSKDEPQRQAGISHFIEHMMFRGTKDMNGAALRRAFANLGIHHGGGTGSDYVDYYMDLLASDLDGGMNLFAKMLTEAAFDPKEFETEKGVVINEIKRAPDDNERKFTHFLFECVYPDTPVARDGLGTEKIIQNLKPDELRKYWKKNYTTNKIVFAARGGVSHIKFVKLCEKLFNCFTVQFRFLYKMLKPCGTRSRQSAPKTAIRFPFRNQKNPLPGHRVTAEERLRDCVCSCVM